MNLIRSRLSRKLFTSVTVMISILVLAIYAISVTLIKQTVFQLEERAGRSVMDTVYALVQQIHLELEGQRTTVLNSRQEQLKSMTDLVTSYSDSIYRQVESGQINRQRGLEMIYTMIRNLRYGDYGYFWLADNQATLVSHPDPFYQGRNFNDSYDEANVLLIAVSRMVQEANVAGEGFYQYQWPRLQDDIPVSKLSYFKNLDEWGLVVGTGIYLDDVEADLKQRYDAAIENLREVLRSITIGETGYLYIFDASYQMIIHPNANIENTDFGALVNPVSQGAIGVELTAIADTQQGRYYLWDRPEDPNNYVYEKISWVRYFPAFDWYIASSVYVEELRESADVLGTRILLIGFPFLLLAIVLSYLFSRHISHPVKLLAATAHKIQNGDLTARSNIQQTDEIGTLSESFDSMVVQLQDNISNLDSKVHHRTAELHSTVIRLQRAKINLAKAERRQRIILDAIPAGVALLDEAHCIRFINQSYAGFLGTEKESLLGGYLPALMQFDQNHELVKHLDRAGQRLNTHFIQSRAQDHGPSRLYKTLVIPEIENDDQHSSTLVITRDITEEKANEQRLLDMQRMSAVAQLAGGLAHDFNNLLSIILGNLVNAREQYATVPELVTCLDPAIHASRRGADITRRLLAFTRSQSLAPSVADASQLLEEINLLLKHSLPASVQIVLEKADEPYMVYVDTGQLENAVINLAFNSRDAMPEGGKITLSLAHREVSDAEGHDVLSPGHYVAINVSDTGQGFTKDAQARAFEPFYTTKRNTGGSGLGLSMVHGFITQSGGDVAIHSVPGEGSTITLLLPFATASQLDNSHRPVQHNEQSNWHGKLALLVEDESELRALVRRQLIKLGFVVLECASADEAEPLALEIDALFLLVVDIVMPGTLNGLDLAERLAEQRPEVVIVPMSGFVDDQLTAIDRRHPMSILQKPFDQTQLHQAIAIAEQARHC